MPESRIHNPQDTIQEEGVYQFDNNMPDELM